jgi:hypothetical protein
MFKRNELDNFGEEFCGSRTVETLWTSTLHVACFDTKSASETVNPSTHFIAMSGWEMGTLEGHVPANDMLL